MFNKQIGVIVGVSEYEKSVWATLPFVRGDIEGPDGLASVLENDLGPCCFATTDIHVRLNTYTHRQNMAFIRQIALDKSLSRDTLLFLYFTGHGFIDKEIGDVPCLIMHNTSLEDPASQGITFKWIRDEIIQKSKATILLVIDSCFSGQILSDFNWSKEVVGDHFAIFTSSAKDQDSFADEDGTQSFFTKRLIEALRGKGIALNNGKVDTDSAIDYLRTSTFRPDQHPQFHKPPTPFLLSIPRQSIIAPPRGTFDESILRNYVNRMKEIGDTEPLQASDKKFVSNRIDVDRFSRPKDTQAAKSDEDDSEINSDLPALDYLIKWAQNSEESFALLLGDTGLGKTTLLRRFFYELCKMNLKGELERYPLFLDLRMYVDVRLHNPAILHKRTSEEESTRRFRAILMDWLQNEEGLAIIWSEFIQLVESGRLILILDGFDEMCLDSKLGTITSSLNLLSSLNLGNSKTILSCRTHFFRSDRQMLETIDCANLAQPNLPIIKLRLFGELQIEQFLEWHLNEKGKSKWRLLKSSRTLGIEQLSRRPFLLNILTHHLQERDETSPSKIFEELLTAWLERDKWRFVQFLGDFSEAINRDLQGLADVMEPSADADKDQVINSDLDFTSTRRSWAEEVICRFIELTAIDLRFADSCRVNSISAVELPDRIKHNFPSLPEVFIDFFEYCIRTCTFLSRDGEGNYSFLHDSVQAFFAAKHILEEIRQNKYRWDKAPDRRQIPITPVPHTLGKAVIDEFLMEFLSDMITISDERQLKDLINQEYFTTRVRMNPNTLFYLCGNALSLLVNSYKKKNISGSLPKNLHDKNISGANLSGTNLQGAKLMRCIMEDVNLQNTNLRGADLTGVKLINADLHAADLQGVKINGGAVIQLRSDQNARDVKDAPPEFMNAFVESKKGTPGRIYAHPKIEGLTDMVQIPGGKFLMGTSAHFADNRERPQHEVQINPFGLDIHPVTNEQYAEFIKSNPEWGKEATIDRLKNVYYLKLWEGNEPPPDKYDHPVVYVSWYAAEAYAKWAGLRLPTEAEWEFALRDGNHDKAWNYPWGPDYQDNPPAYQEAMRRREITSVNEGIRSVNYQLYEMSGNVNEWVNDWFGEDYFEQCKRRADRGQVEVNPKGPPFGREKVLRGGSYLDDPKEFHRTYSCFYRSFLIPQNTNQDGGFRCARNVNR